MSCFLAGLSNGVLAPFSFSLLGLLVEGKLPDLFSFAALVAIFATASAIGLITCLVVGFPVLLLLRKLNQPSPVFSSGIGIVVGLVFAAAFFYSGASYNFSESWPIAVFYTIHGGFSGYLAGWLTQHNKSFKSDTGSAGAA